MDIEAEKAALRTALAERRAGLAKAAPDAAERAALNFPPALAAPKIAAGYVRFRTELDPAPLMARLAALGASLALPRTPPRDNAGPLTFHSWTPDRPLTRGAFGVLEPAADAHQVDPDLVLVPLLGFDRAGRRLGYGQGHYDRALAAMRAARPIVAVGLAYAGQEVPAAPFGPHDEPLDWIVTEREAFRPG